MGETNRKLTVPKISVDKITLGRRGTCWIGDVYIEEISCADMSCDNCIFCDKNIHSGLLYLLSKGYITKEQAMEVSLGG